MQEWTFQASDNSYYSNMYVGSDDTLYTVDGRMLYAIGRQGIKWNTELPVPAGDLGTDSRLTIESAVSDSSGIYMITFPADNQHVGEPGGQLAAVSPSGRVMWTIPVNVSCWPTLFFRNETIYLYENGYSLKAIDKHGQVLSQLTGLIYPPVVAENGVIYERFDSASGLEIRSFYPNGTPNGSVNLGDFEPTSSNWGDFAYSNGTVYLWTDHGVMTIGRDGMPKWLKRYPDERIYWLQSPVPDSDGLLYIGRGAPVTAISVISVEGNETTLTNNVSIVCSSWISNGIAYHVETGADDYRENLTDLRLGSLTAYDVMTGRQLWSYTITPPEVHLLKPDEAELAKYAIYSVPHTDDNQVPTAEWYRVAGISPGSRVFRGEATQDVALGDRAVYLRYWAYNYEYPFFTGQSNFTYTGGLVALNKTDGRELWNLTTDSLVTDVEEANGTVYYRTLDGRFSGIASNISAGLLAASAYLFLRFFGAATVARARSSLHQNANRNQVLQLIVERPGSTVYEIARLLGLNIGTVRYHLLILSVNHKVTAYSDDSKFVRYFTNSNTYSEEEKLLISCLRRESVRRLLATLLQKPGMTNAELSEELGLPRSAVSLHLNSLAAAGFVRKEVLDRKQVFTVDARHQPAISRFIAVA